MYALEVSLGVENVNNTRLNNLFTSMLYVQDNTGTSFYMLSI